MRLQLRQALRAVAVIQKRIAAELASGRHQVGSVS
jgi:hypothetical protein